MSYRSQGTSVREIQKLPFCDSTGTISKEKSVPSTFWVNDSGSLGLEHPVAKSNIVVKKKVLITASYTL
jgi:hypothetical protein